MREHSETPATPLKDGKADFDAAYGQDDPRSYFDVLGSLDYVIPHHAQAIFRELLAAQASRRNLSTPHVLDVCCSYGVNAALMTCDLSLADLEERYRGPATSGLSTEGLAQADRTYFAEHREPGAPVVSGLDVSEPAVRYASRVGLLEHGAVENLEEAPPSPELGKIMSEVDMITVTGGVGYVTARTFANLYDAAGDDPPWLAAFTLRRFSYHDIADVLAGHGLVTERLAGTTFPQRRFASNEEQEFTLHHLHRSGLDVSGREADGRFHTDFYLSRPASEAAERPLGALLAGHR